MRRALGFAALLWLAGTGAGAAGQLGVAGHWRSSEGLPLDSVNSVAIDRDGHLWLASSDGLTRFDGLDFSHFDRNSGPPLPANRIARLHTLDDGSLLVHFDDHTFGLFSTDAGYRPIGRAHPNRLVVAGSDVWYPSSNGLVRWSAQRGSELLLTLPVREIARLPGVAGASFLLGTESGQIHRYTPDSNGLVELASVGAPILGLAAGPDGEFAFATQLGLHRHDARGERTVPADIGLLKDPLVRVGLEWTPAGYLVSPLATRGPSERLSLFDGERLVPLGDARLAGVQGNRHSLRDARGRLWTNEGLQLRRDGEVVHRSEQPILDFVIDRYDQVWVGTLRGGLFKLTEPLLSTLGAEPGALVDSNIYHVARDGEHGLWVGSYRGLDHLDLRELRWTRVREQRSLAVLDDAGDVLVAGEQLCTLRSAADNTCRPVEALAAHSTLATLLHRDRAGGLWLGAADGLRYRDPEGRWLGPLRPGVRAREALELDGGQLLIGTADDGVLSVDIDAPLRSLRTLIDESSGLPSNRVRALFLDRPDEILIGTEDRGLCRLRLSSGVLRCIGVAEGLPHHSVHRIIADDQGRLWVNSNAGIYVVARDDLRAVLSGVDNGLSARRFGTAEGMLSSEGNGGVNSAGTRSADGRIWFPTQRGLVMIQPERIAARDVPLTATLEPLTPGSNRGRIRLPPDARVLRVRLGAIALRGSADVQLRYRMNERDWTTAQPGELTLDGLSPGTHTLRAEARYADGDWSGPNARLEFEVPAHFSETGAFRVAVAAGVLLLFAALYLRERSHARRLERKVKERTASLHSAMQTVSEQAERIRSDADSRHRWYLTISHELRTPLTTLLGPLEVARPQPSPQQLERMRRSATQIRDMVEELLLLERLGQGGSQRFHTERLASLLRRALEPHRVSAEERGVDLELILGDNGDTSHEDVRVRAESTQLERAVGTLVGNALMHATAGPVAPLRAGRAQVRVTLECAAEGASATIHVDDDGPGIPPAERGHVLQPFARGRAGSGEGLGLGLSLCQRIVDNHRGRLEIGDSPLGGARLTITLPVLPAPPTGHASRQQAAADARVVLAVDDNPDIRSHLDEVLGTHYRVLFAENGEEGLQVASAELPDAILCDVSMPVMDGLDMVRRLRAEPDTSAIPVIFLTAHAREEIEARAYAAGGDQFIAKPFRSDQLVLRLERLFALRRDLLARYARPADPAPPEPRQRRGLMDKLDALIEARIGDPDLDIDTLCREIGVSRATLYRRMERSTGQTPNDLLRERRLDLAARLLRESDEQVSAVAYAVGFRHLSSFTRSFSARFGCAPSMYRRSARESSS